MTKNTKTTIVEMSKDDLIRVQTPEEAVGSGFFVVYENEMEALDSYKQKMRNKRKEKRKNDKKKDPVYKTKHLEVLEERNHKGFVLQLVQNDFGYYMTTSPMFKKGCYSIQRKSAEAAFKQGQYIIHCVYNYEDIKEEFLTDDGFALVESGDYHSCKAWSEECICKGEE